MFIYKQATDKNVYSKTLATTASNNTTSNGGILSSFFKPAIKVKKPDEKFEEMKDTVDKFQDNLHVIEKLYSRIGRRQQELENNYKQFAASIRGLSGLETNVDQPLRQFAESIETYANAYKERVRMIIDRL